jgi:hypothetical protein
MKYIAVVTLSAWYFTLETDLMAETHLDITLQSACALHKAF